MASYPSSVKAFSTKNTGNQVQAAHINDMQSEITAIETDLLTAFPLGLAPSGSGGPFDWTPQVTFAVAGDLMTAYSVQVGKGFKHGSDVWLTGAMTLSTFTHTTASGNLIITGNPYTATNSTGLSQVGACTIQGYTKANYTSPNISIAANSTNLVIALSGSGQTIAVVSSGDTPTGGALSIFFALKFTV